jgi:dihydroorotate dehydrogenase subfamily 2
MNLYSRLLKPVLFRFDPEFVHNTTTTAGEMLGSNPLYRNLVNLFYGYHGPQINKVVDGLNYKTPVLLSAGYDQDGRLTQILGSVGFGGEEIGSVTNLAYEGNPKPRFTRLPKSKSMIVNKGLKNEGVDKIIKRLKKRKKFIVQGISIARSNNESCAATAAGIEDYCATLRKLSEANVGDYYTINISCPNAFGGEDFADPVLLAKLLKSLTAIKHGKPVYVKMPINKPWDKFNELLKVIDNTSIRGIVIGNLNKNYDDLDFRAEAPQEFRGGLSGKPTFKLSNELISETREKYGKRFTIFGVGGIMTPEDALEKFKRGADLVQLITGMIYSGPALIKRIDRIYADQFAHVSHK